MVTSRFLTDEAKGNELAEWGRLKAYARPAEGRREDGFADLEMVELCDALNALPGVCTLQSCAGHGAGLPPHLWIWLAQPLAEAMGEWAPILGCLPGIERVSTIHQPWGQEVTAIILDGRSDQYKRSVLLFFRALSATSSSRPSV